MELHGSQYTYVKEKKPNIVDLLKLIRSYKGSR
jgi:hypothetical protein